MIPVAEQLAQDGTMYVITTEADHPMIVGVPRLFRANLFVCVMSSNDAWQLAAVSAKDERIIKVDLFRSVTAAHRSLIEKVLTAKLSAVMVGD